MKIIFNITLTTNEFTEVYSFEITKNINMYIYYKNNDSSWVAKKIISYNVFLLQQLKCHLCKAKLENIQLYPNIILNYSVVSGSGI